MDYESIKRHFNVKHYKKNSGMAICPCHDDKKASLSISYDSKEKKTLLYCHAGCDIKDVLKRVGLELRDLYEDERPKEKSRDKIEAVYKYTGSDGALLFEKIRFKPKAFTQRRYMEGSVVWGLGGGRYYETYPGSNEYSQKERNNARTREFPETRPVLYNLPAVIKGVGEKKTIFIVEGEKDADNLIVQGLIATTSFDGASKSMDRQKWRKEYNVFLKGAEVVLIPDNDNPGRSHMMNIARELKGVAKSVKMVELPVPEKEDVSFYLGEGHSIDELLNMVRNTLHVGEYMKGENFSLLKYHFSDVGNAERLIALYGSDIRYSFPEDKFYIWSGRHWQADNTGTISKMARTTLRRLLAEAEEINETADEADKAVKRKVQSFVIKSENDSRIRAMIHQAKSQPEITLRECDSDLFLLNVGNGTLDLRTGKLMDYKKSDYITRMIDIEYDEKAECVNWLSFLDKIFMGNREMVDFVQRSIGYSLTGSEEEQCFYMLYGSGANGKTTFLNTIKMIMGDYSDTLRASSLMTRQFDDGARGDIAKLQGRRFVVTSELNDGQYFDESLLKCVTGGEAIPVRFLYGSEFALRPEFKLWMGTNEKPRIRGTDMGIWRRVRLIPFLYTFSGDERDKKYMDKFIVPELPGILNWAVQGSMKWQREGIEIPQISMSAVEEYKDEMDVVQRFIDEACLMGDIYISTVRNLYESFCTWCGKSGDRSVTSIKFGKKLKEKGFEQNKSGCCRYWKGIGVLDLKWKGQVVVKRDKSGQNGTGI